MHKNVSENVAHTAIIEKLVAKAIDPQDNAWHASMRRKDALAPSITTMTLKTNFPIPEAMAMMLTSVATEELGMLSSVRIAGIRQE